MQKKKKISNTYFVRVLNHVQSHVQLHAARQDPSLSSYKHDLQQQSFMLCHLREIDDRRTPLRFCVRWVSRTRRPRFQMLYVCLGKTNKNISLCHRLGIMHKGFLAQNQKGENKSEKINLLGVKQNFKSFIPKYQFRNIFTSVEIKHFKCIVQFHELPILKQLFLLFHIKVHPQIKTV